LNNKLSEKDKKDWENFLNNKDPLEVKDKELQQKKTIMEKSIDLHGLTLNEANNKMYEFIKYCYENNVKKINVITGKGMRSKNINDPYQSKDLSILKHSVPEYIKGNSELMNRILKIDFEAVNSSSVGSFDIFLKITK
tara:strand:- start:179 stop:592 length:414 start_codon:yes stop_codon:yes gene_type:complete